MTPTKTTPSRPASRRPARAAVRLLFCTLLGACALPAFAQQAALVSNLAVAPAARAVAMSEPRPQADGSLMFPGQINSLLVAQARQTRPDANAAGRVQTVLKRALALLGTPYRWGGTSPEGGFDCSGLVGYVFRTALGIELPRISREMAQNGQLISDRAALAAGDLVFFGRKGRVDHVGIYLGEGNFVHAPRTGRDVTVSSLTTGYWGGKFLQARRVAGI